MTTTTSSGGSGVGSATDDEKLAKIRLTTLRLYRILLRLSGSLVPTADDLIVLQNDIVASDWGHHCLYANRENDDDFVGTSLDGRTEELLRLFLVLIGVDPVSGISLENDWYESLIGVCPSHAIDNPKRTCWTTTMELRKAIRFAFRLSSSSSSSSSSTPNALQSLALRAIQVVQDQAVLWSQSSVSTTPNGLVRVTATSKCLGIVSPVSMAAVPSSPLMMPKYRFAYRIRVENVSETETVQLLGRYWHISETPDDDDDDNDYNDGDDDEHNDRNDPVQVDAPYTGAVGQLPVLQPGRVFEYVSGTDLATPKGEMKGHLYMATVPPQTRSAKAGDDVATVLESTPPLPTTGKGGKAKPSNQTRFFQAPVAPFTLECLDRP